MEKKRIAIVFTRVHKLFVLSAFIISLLGYVISLKEFEKFINSISTKEMAVVYEKLQLGVLALLISLLIGTAVSSFVMGDTLRKWIKIVGVSVITTVFCVGYLLCIVCTVGIYRTAVLSLPLIYLCIALISILLMSKDILKYKAAKK